MLPRVSITVARSFDFVVVDLYYIEPDTPMGAYSRVGTYLSESSSSVGLIRLGTY